MSWQMLIGDAVIASTFFVIGRSVARIRLARTIQSMAKGYRRTASQLGASWKPADVTRAHELLGKSEALCELVDRL